MHRIILATALVAVMGLGVMGTANAKPYSSYPHTPSTPCYRIAKEIRQTLDRGLVVTPHKRILLAVACDAAPPMNGHPLPATD